MFRSLCTFCFLIFDLCTLTDFLVLNYWRLGNGGMFGNYFYFFSKIDIKSILSFRFKNWDIALAASYLVEHVHFLAFLSTVCLPCLVAFAGCVIPFQSPSSRVWNTSVAFWFLCVVPYGFGVSFDWHQSSISTFSILPPMVVSSLHFKCRVFTVLSWHHPMRKNESSGRKWSDLNSEVSRVLIHLKTGGSWASDSELHLHNYIL